jgi:hypothetical protein
MAGSFKIKAVTDLNNAEVGLVLQLIVFIEDKNVVNLQ